MTEREIDAGWIGKRIARLRVERGWTQGALAARVDLSTTQLSRIESAARQPSLGTLIELARTFGVTLSELVEDEATTAYHLSRRSERVSREIAGGKLSTLSGHFPGLEAVQLTLDRGSSTPEAQHTGEEFLCVLAGAVDVTVQTDTLALSLGDALQFPARLSHVIRNTGEETAEVLIVSTHSQNLQASGNSETNGRNQHGTAEPPD
ncbi:helix-turn-helix domain-containing protein [Nocardia sp. NPDC052566]|uniref:helix-turn-helix domain-containing protein n=1 Tax=Nocardia sp. NPDC052566 TaxID=3364330 RepID=UPI0037C95E6A